MIRSFFHYFWLHPGEIPTRGVLPESKYLSQRDPGEIKALLDGPRKGGKHLYTVVFPP